MSISSGGALLAADDPPPVVIHNPGARSPFLLVGDHAGCAIPRALGTLGVGAADRARHIAWDIGTAALGRALSARLDAVFVHQAYSRLVIDCNRAPDAPDAIPAASDGTPVPANRALAPEAAAARVAAIHAPYQEAIATEIARRRAAGHVTILIALHSFTPRLGGGAPRPWEVGVLYAGGRTDIARALLARLRATALTVGDNEPYRMDATDHTVPRHAYPDALPYAEIEIRQDQLADPAGIERWAAILGDALTGLASGG